MKRIIVLAMVLALVVPGVVLAQSQGVSLEGLAGYVRALQHRVRAVEERLPTVEEQLAGVYSRLEKTEQYEQRIRELERQVAELEPQVSERSPDVVVMTEAEYQQWLADETVRISFLVPAWELAFESDDPDLVFGTLHDMLETIFEFHDAHSRIVTSDLEYEMIQSNLTCYLKPLDILRDLENTTIVDFMIFLGHLGDDPESVFVGCDLDVLDDLEKLFSVE